MDIPFLSFDAQHAPLRAAMLEAFARVYDTQQYVLGPEVEAFEREYAAFSHVQQAVGVSNGLEALTLALRALGIGRGDEVIVPSNTYIATWLAVTHVGATPIPVEPDPATSNIDPARLGAAISSRTRAILPVHLYGQACRMTDIMRVADAHGLYVLEDNAQAQGAAFAGRPTGSFGQLNATSFYPGKNLGALGDAGAITTNNSELAECIRLLRNYGSRRKYHNEIAGYNARLDELQAALLRVKLPHLPVWTRQRQQLARQYEQCLAGVGDLVLPWVAPEASHVYHLYVVHTTRRDELQRYLTAQGIGTLTHYPVPPHLQPAYKTLAYPVGSYPIAEQLAATCLSLPLWPGLSQAQVARVCTAIQQFFTADYPGRAFHGRG